jgi:hypothetical protein
MEQIFNLTGKNSLVIQSLKPLELRHLRIIDPDSCSRFIGEHFPKSTNLGKRRYGIVKAMRLHTCSYAEKLMVMSFEE